MVCKIKWDSKNLELSFFSSVVRSFSEKPGPMRDRDALESGGLCHRNKTDGNIEVSRCTWTQKSSLVTFNDSKHFDS
jgi:hypothetical protein